jgi:hypothetical protein
MIEIVNHLLGTCGEGHPNVISMMLVGAVVWCAVELVRTAVRAR